jgi:hypothetical protein
MAYRNKRYIPFIYNIEVMYFIERLESSINKFLVEGQEGKVRTIHTADLYDFVIECIGTLPKGLCATYIKIEEH